MEKKLFSLSVLVKIFDLFKTCLPYDTQTTFNCFMLNNIDVIQYLHVYTEIAVNYARKIKNFSNRETSE